MNSDSVRLGEGNDDGRADEMHFEINTIQQSPPWSRRDSPRNE